MNYLKPGFISEKVSIEVYKKWLDNKSKSLYFRDKRRGQTKGETRKDYKIAIHKAVIDSNGKDFYTNELLTWDKIGTYNNHKSKILRGKYRKEFYRLPTVDHYNIDSEELEFRICSWIVNDSKSDLSYEEYLKLCEKILRQATLRI